MPLSPEAFQKYDAAALACNKVLPLLIDECKPGTKVIDLCILGDSKIVELITPEFPKVKSKGVAFPTNISVNECVCHYSPLQEEVSVVLKEGDIVKISFGAHIDGYIACSAYTVAVGKPSERAADAIRSAYLCAEAAFRLLKTGNSNFSITDKLHQVAKSFNTTPVSGMVSHEIQQNVIAGDKEIILNPSDQQRRQVKEFQFRSGDVFCIDVLISTGDGKSKEGNQKTWIYKKTGYNYSLKMKTSRAFMSEVSQKSNMMPFCLRSFDDAKKARLGLQECVKHGLVDPYPVLYEKAGEFVAQFMFTCVIESEGARKLTVWPNLETCSDDFVNENLAALEKDPQ